MIRDVPPGSVFLSISDPGAKKAQDLGSWIRIGNNGYV